jgi:hypothetical protein
MVGRLARDLPRFLKYPLALSTARTAIRQRLARREAGFFDMMERAVFSRPRSPYARLLKIAGCEPGDIQSLVHQDGLEDALATLARKGVYVAFDELKGRREVVRGSQRLRFRDRDFDNPLIAPHLVTFTRGSRGRPSRVIRSLDAYEALAAFVGVAMAAHGIEQSRHLLWLQGPIDWLMMHSKLGRNIEHWYYPLPGLPWQVRYGALVLAAIGKAGKYQYPAAHYADLGEPARMARRLYERQASAPALVVNMIVSSAVRVAIEAERAGFDLSRVTFLVDCEPMTEARRRPIDAVGARVIVNYGSMELNTLGYSCATGLGPDDLHFASDRYALADRDREAVPGGPNVSSLLFTALTPFEAKVALNVEMGDSATVEARDCPCDLGQLGFRTHLSNIRSFEKLSGEGVTFARSDLTHLMESVVPRQFGGTSLDYQLVEQETSVGATHFIVRAHPSVGTIDQDALRTVILSELARGDLVTRHQAELLARSGTIQIVRAPPLATRAGKVLPFHLASKVHNPTG